MKSSDLLLFGMAKNAVPRLSGEGITLCFSAEVYADAVKKSIDTISALLGCPVSVTVGSKKEEADKSAESRAKALFGDALRITD